MNPARERLASIYKGRAIACWIMCAGVIALAVTDGRPVLSFLVLALLESTLNQPYLYQRRARKINPVTLARVNITIDIIVFTIGLHLFGGYRSGILLSGYMLIMLYAFLAVRPREGIIATVLSIGAFSIMFLLESNHLIAAYPKFAIDEGTSTIALIIITMMILLLPAQVGRNIYSTILAQENRLKSALERNLRLFLEAHDAVLTITPEARVEQANPKAAELFNQPIKNMPGRTLTEILAPESTDDLAVLIQNVSTGQHVSGSNLRLKLADGAERVVEVSAMPLQREHGAAGIFIVLRDVTERRRLEDELKRYSEELELRVERRTAELEESKERCQSTFEKAAVPLAWLDPDGTLQSANKCFYGMTGLDKNIEGKFQLVEILDDLRDRRQVADYLVLHRKGYDAPSRLELAIRGAAGKILSTEWFIRFEPLTDQLLVSIIDETETRLAEKAMRESEERYRTLVETSPDAIVMVDLAGNILTANHRALELWGGPGLKELIGRNAFPLVAERERQRAVERLASTVAMGQVRDYELTLLRHDGSEYPAEASGTLVRDANNQPSAIIVTFRDITERREIEEARRRLNDQLLQAEHMAGVGQVATGVAQDMNSPITAISYYSQALEKLQYIKKADREKLKRIEESADRIQRLIARIINYASTQSASFEPVDLNTLIRQVLDALSRELEKRPGARLETGLDDQLPKVEGSAEHLFDLVSNLVINALQALGKKKGQVTVSTRREESAVLLIVSDTGVGIPENELAEIFTPFVSRRKDGQGAGLGLAIVQRVARLHGGEVKVESQPGHGTTFTVSLPAAGKP